MSTGCGASREGGARGPAARSGKPPRVCTSTPAPHCRPLRRSPARAGKKRRSPGHDRLHRRLEPHAVRQAREPRRREPDRRGGAGRRRRCRASRPADIDEIWLGHFNGGFVEQDFTSSLVLQADPALRFKPATRVENACATGSAAVHAGLRAIAAREARIVLVVGVEKMTELAGPEIGETLLKASYLKEEAGIEGGFAGVFGQIAAELFPAPRRPVGRAGGDRRQEPHERLRQSLCPDAQGSGLRVLPHRRPRRTRSSPGP